MTESENIDKIESGENITVTSDAAFERVTSDIKMEDGTDGGYLKQNTAGLVQEIPNISILDIGDFLIENKKTLYDRQNWNIVVGKAGRSIEAQPQDAAILTYTGEFFHPTSETTIIPFDEIKTASNASVFEIVGNKAVINQAGLYRVSYGWVCLGGTNDVVSIEIRHERSDGTWVSGDYLYDTFISSTGLSSGGKTGWIECEEGDVLYMKVDSDSYASIQLQGLYMEIQFLQYSL